MPVNIYQLLFVFLIYAFIGWCCEVAFAAVELGKFVNRGFLNGPVCPIYGVGMIIILAGLWPLRSNFILLFIGAAVLTTVLEFITGFILEKAFNEKWWDYSDLPFNIKGYVCLKFTLLWGFAATFTVAVVHRFIFFMIQKTPMVLGIVLLSLFIALFITDLTVTLIELAKLPKKVNAMIELEAAIKKMSDLIGQNISDKTLAATAKGSELIEEGKPKLEELKAELEKKKEDYKRIAAKSNFVHNRILKAFPNLKNGKYKEVSQRISNLKVYVSERIRDEKHNM